VTRSSAVATLVALGVPLAGKHGSVEELAEMPRPARQVPFHFEGQCRGKRRHASREAARREAHRSGIDRFGVVEYRCPFGGSHWHNGRPQ
jgi:hypothetical protein